MTSAPSSSIFSVTRRLEGVASVAAWRDFGAFAAALIVRQCAGGALLRFAPLAQLALLAAVTAGLLATSRSRAAAAAAAACACALVTGPPNLWWTARLGGAWYVEAFVWGAVAAALAAGTRALVEHRGEAGTWLVRAAVALIIANLWVTTFYIDGRSVYAQALGTRVPSLFDQIDGVESVPQLELTDDYLYVRLYQKVRSGTPFYEAFRSIPVERGGLLPSEAYNYRLPTFYVAWAALPGGARGVVGAFLLLATAAMVSVVSIGRDAVRAPYVIVGSAALAAFAINYSVQHTVLYVDAWSGLLLVLAAAAYAHASRGEGASFSRPWFAGAVALVTLAAVGRDILALALFAGLASAAVGDRTTRRFRAGVWACGVGTFAAAYAMHVYAVRDLVTHEVAAGGLRSMPGVVNVLDAITYGSTFWGGREWIMYAIATIGLLGMLAVRDKGFSAFALLGAGVPLASFAFVGNRAQNFTGETVNYWGALVQPLLYAFIPAGFAFLPGASASDSGRLPERREAALEE